MVSCQGVEEGSVPMMTQSNEVGETFTPTAVSSSTQDEPDLTGYEFPDPVNPSERYLFYLHGRIIEDQGIPAVSPESGEYRYEEILRTLQSHGFVVISEQRPKDAESWEYAQRTAAQVARLLAAGVSPGSITIVGASKGGAIAALVSHLVDNSEVNYVLLGTCHPTLVAEWLQGDLTLSGNVLSIYDFADNEYSGSCEELFSLAEGQGLDHHAELVLQVGTGHGVLYAPLSEWVLPTVQWAQQDW